MLKNISFLLFYKGCHQLVILQLFMAIGTFACLNSKLLCCLGFTFSKWSVYFRTYCTRYIFCKTLYKKSRICIFRYPTIDITELKYDFTFFDQIRQQFFAPLRLPSGKLHSVHLMREINLYLDSAMPNN